MNETSWALPKSDGQGLEKLPRMRDTKSGAVEKTRNTSMVWHSLYEKELYVTAALPSSADSFPSGSQRDHTLHSFRSMHQPHTMKRRRSNSLPKGGRGCLMSPPCLESQGCHLIPLCISSLVLLPSSVTLSVLSFFLPAGLFS